MGLLVTSVPADELLSAEEAKRHLRIINSDHDTEIGDLIRAARDYCERFTQRTLRAAVTRTKTFDEWWRGDFKLEFPPILASPAPTITYYDTLNASQTLAASNYYLDRSTDGGAKLIWTPSASLPSLYDRNDAITVTYTAGYSSLTAVPPAAVRAMKLKLTEYWGTGTETELEAARKAADRLLGLIDWTGYA